MITESNEPYMTVLSSSSGSAYKTETKTLFGVIMPVPTNHPVLIDIVIVCVRGLIDVLRRLVIV